MVVDWDWDSSGLELDRRELVPLVLGWRGWRWRYLQKQRAYQRLTAPGEAVQKPI